MTAARSLCLALLLALAGAGLATAQDNETSTAESSPTYDELIGTGAFQDFFGLGGTDVSPVLEVDREGRRTIETNRDVDLDRDNVFNALALAQHGANVSFDDIADVVTERRVDEEASAFSNLEQETVFSALALGLTADDGGLATLADAGGSVDRSRSSLERVEHDVNLDRDTTLLAIALANSAGGEVRLSDVAEVNHLEEFEATADQDVNLDEEDAFLALALGLGGTGSPYAETGNGAPPAPEPTAEPTPEPAPTTEPAATPNGGGDDANATTTA